MKIKDKSEVFHDHLKHLNYSFHQKCIKYYCGGYQVVFDIDDTIIINGYEYEIEVTSEHLAVSNLMNFTASPGTDDNRDFGEWFFDADGDFYVFAHFSVQYK